MSLIVGPIAPRLGIPSDLSVPGLKAYLCAQKEVIRAAFSEGVRIDYVLGARALVIDRVLDALWSEAGLDDSPLGLFAVGGYGRGELHPESDVDILILGDREAIATGESQITQFTTRLWDLHVQIGHAVRTLDDCQRLVAADVTVATSLIECRAIVARPQLTSRLEAIAFDDALWSSRAFFDAKVAEQALRYAKHDDSDNRLEPDVKHAPGGLRDLHTIIWVTRRHFRTTRLITLVDEGLLTEAEFHLLDEAEDFLKRVRFCLHEVSGRPQNRLLFDQQGDVALRMGYTDTDPKARIERFMKQFYRMTVRLGEFNDMLLQHFRETVMSDPSEAEVTPFNARWQIRGNRLELVHANGFNRTPSALLEAFVILASHPEIEGLRAATTRQMYTARHLIDDDFRKDIRNISLFMELLRYPIKLPEQLRRMRLFGILSRYIPAFGRIMGLMQHDLFHIYTVDAHTLQLIRNITRFYRQVDSERFPLASELTPRLPKIELLYLAALFHDIAKGRGGDHSELGAEDADAFCRHHRLPDYDARLVSWLVTNHLLMSMTAQRKDLSDPQEVARFAEIVGDERRLNYLYCLTVADITATNPELWTSWRASLLRQLYYATADVLKRGLDQLPGRAAYIDETKADALELIRPSQRAAAQAFWAQWSTEYFVSHSSDELAWHIEALLDQPLPAVAIAPHAIQEDGSSTQVLISTPNRAHLFADLAACLSDLGLSILDAKLHTSQANNSLDVFIVQNAFTGSAITDPEDQSLLLKSLSLAAEGQYIASGTERRMPRIMKYFTMPASVKIAHDLSGQKSLIEVVAPDRSGLLTVIGRVFAEFGLDLYSAKIATLGERVEDVFYVTDERGQSLYDADFTARLKARLESELNAHTGAHAA